MHSLLQKGDIPSAKAPLPAGGIPLLSGPELLGAIRGAIPALQASVRSQWSAIAAVNATATEGARRATEAADRADRDLRERCSEEKVSHVVRVRRKGGAKGKSLHTHT